MLSSLMGLRGLCMCGDRSQLVDMLRAVTDDPLEYITFKLVCLSCAPLLAGLLSKTSVQGDIPAGRGGFFRAPPGGFLLSSY